MNLKTHLTIASLLCVANLGFSTSIFVSPDGSGDGSEKRPMSLLSAIASLEQVTPTMQEDLTIIMDDGRYQVDETIALTELEGEKWV